MSKTKRIEKLYLKGSAYIMLITALSTVFMSLYLGLVKFDFGSVGSLGILCCISLILAVIFTAEYQNN